MKKWAVTLKHQVSFGRSPFAKVKNKNGAWVYNSGEGPIPANYKMLLLSTTYAFNPSFKLCLGIENLLNTYYFSDYARYQALDRDFSVMPGLRAMLRLQYKF